MASAMLRPFSKTLSKKETGKDFMFLRTRVIKANPPAAKFLGHFLADIALVAEPLADEVFGQFRHRRAVSLTLPGVSLRATILRR